VESAKDESVSIPVGYALLDERTHGDTQITILRL